MTSLMVFVGQSLPLWQGEVVSELQNERAKAAKVLRCRFPPQHLA